MMDVFVCLQEMSPTVEVMMVFNMLMVRRGNKTSVSHVCVDMASPSVQQSVVNNPATVAGSVSQRQSAVLSAEVSWTKTYL